MSEIGEHLLILSYGEDSKPAVRIILPNVSDYEEIAFDTLTMRDHGQFKSKDYQLAANQEQSQFFIVSPKDIIVATEPDDEDHLNWLLENEQYSEELDLKFQN